MIEKEFTFITICGGLGMGSEALKQLGGRELACIDIGDLQEIAYSLNHASGCFVKMDIKSLTMDTLNAYLNKVGKPSIAGVDVILFSTPCTYFSMLNNYATAFHEMNLLTIEQIPRIVDSLKPNLGFICENTAALSTSKKAKLALRELKQKLKKIGAYTFNDTVLDSADFNCWTSRPRWIMFGKSKKYTGEIKFPEAQTTDYSKYFLSKLITDAIAYTPGLYRMKEYDSTGKIAVGKSEKWLSANRVLGTVTATGGEKIRLRDGTERSLTIEELRIIFGIEHFDFGDLSDQQIHFLIGNGIVVPFMREVAKGFLGHFHI